MGSSERKVWSTASVELKKKMKQGIFPTSRRTTSSCEVRQEKRDRGQIYVPE